MPKLILTAYESETHISYNDSERGARVYTCNKTLIKRMDKLVAEDNAVLIREDECSKTYSVNKKYVKILPPRKIKMTDEQKEKMKERFAASRIKKKVKSLLLQQ